MLKSGLIKYKNLFIFFFAFTITIFILFNSFTTFEMAKRSSRDLLDSTAYFIGITLDQALNRSGIDEDLFLDLIKAQAWEEIAYIALYNSDGKILLHSSKRLIGESDDNMKFLEPVRKSSSESSYIQLKTGETVYVMDMVVHIHAYSPSIHLLRIALHTHPSQKIITNAKVHTLTALAVIGFLWVMAFAFFRYSKRLDTLNKTQMEKKHLATLGEMSAVLAHEIRSPLSAIKGFAQYMNEKKEDGPSSEGLGVIIEESQRLEQLTEELLVYARMGESVDGEFSISRLIEEAEGFLSFGEKSITIEKGLSADDNIYTDRGKLRQVLINVMQNAVDSIGVEGKIKVTTEVDHKSLLISIRDTGEGMDEKTMQNVLNPFFTTKSRGTGLGLAIVSNLLNSLNGSLNIESVPQKGTEVKMKIKRALR